jgi:membrane-bound inhibitor of C-type lysozyme
MHIHQNLLAASLCILGGCATAAPDHTMTSSAPTWTSYTCTDGQVVQAAYPDTQTALIKIKGETLTLHVAMSASGARYIGAGWQWWTKGMHDGMLAPLATGENIASAPGLNCHAS